ncbi:glycosyl transferase family 1 [Streptomyces spinoverrucosus]|uniref:D-inositol 3-phosphate glycosyltransferase n=1 Tax=Streptomyces spinoverrucosus TaxID=284043 RepID=A0A4Y3VMC1_9ACTN|nr:glycosyltransferase [Streptomyces spinoverrucosus]GEC07693.1 glycosyl transferase family 1 [Streptomyces spinoverrucosus]GHB65402.1 glycosyl transferase family 1 [Streptomyces spinoverrucosus]
MRILVVTVVHHPEDARILHREIAALTERGHRIVYAAPFSARGVVPRPGVEGVDLPRAAGRDRRAALRSARALLAERGPEADVVLLHDPELLLALPGTLRRWRRAGRAPVTVWDVHEDTAAALTMKRWVPAALRPPLKLAVRAAERLAERHVRLLLAEDAYRARFRRPHPVVPNLPTVPPGSPEPPGTDRVVYLGHLSRARGALDLIETARLLGPDVRVEVIGAADPDVRGALTAADRDGILHWHDYLPNDRALALLSGALAGLSLLHDQPNYRHSRPTKVVEYMAHGVPVVTTPNPLAADLVTRHRCGLVVPYGNPAAAADAVRRLRTDAALRLNTAERGRAAVLAELDWAERASEFTDRLETWVKEAAAGQASGAPPQEPVARLRG